MSHMCLCRHATRVTQLRRPPLRPPLLQPLLRPRRRPRRRPRLPPSLFPAPPLLGLPLAEYHRLSNRLSRLRSQRCPIALHAGPPGDAHAHAPGSAQSHTVTLSCDDSRPHQVRPMCPRWRGPSLADPDHEIKRILSACWFRWAWGLSTWGLSTWGLSTWGLSTWGLSPCVPHFGRN